jgi:predicted transcriptional regulator
MNLLCLPNTQSGRSQYQNLKNELINSGWITRTKEGYNLTNSGTWFLKMFYDNEKLRSKLK